jgi:hypothetical protein
MENESTLQDDYEKIKKEGLYKLESIKRLANNEDFKNWVNDIIKPNIELIEAELASEKADTMSEVVLRAKFKHLSSLKYLFIDVFSVVNQQLEEQTNGD